MIRISIWGIVLGLSLALLGCADDPVTGFDEPSTHRIAVGLGSLHQATMGGQQVACRSVVDSVVVRVVVEGTVQRRLAQQIESGQTEAIFEAVTVTGTSARFEADIISNNGTVVYGGNQTADLEEGFQVMIPVTRRSPVLRVCPDLLVFEMNDQARAFRVFNRGSGSLNWSIVPPEVNCNGDECVTFGAVNNVAAGDSVDLMVFRNALGPMRFGMAMSSAAGTVPIEVELRMGNQPPELVEAFGNRIFDKDTNETVDDVSVRFNDPEGDPLTFAAESSDPTTATAEIINGSTLRLNRLRAGSATITVTASDGFGEAEGSFLLTLDPSYDLDLQMDADRTQMGVDEKVTFTLTLTHTGTDAATGVRVEDVLPDGLLFDSHHGDGSYNPNTGIWEIGTLASGETVEQNLTATMTGAINKNDKVENLATIITGLNGDIDEDNNAAGFTVERINLPPVVQVPIDPVRMVLGDQRAFNLAAVFEDPDGDPMTFSATSNFPMIAQGDPNGDILNLTTGPQAGSATITVEADDGEAVTNHLFGVTALLIDLQIEVFSNKNQATLGEEVVFTVRLTNLGPGTPPGEIKVDNPIASGLDYVSHDGPGMYDPETGLWIIEPGLPVQVAAELKLTTRINADVAINDVIFNVANLIDGIDFDPDDFNNSAAASVVRSD